MSSARSARQTACWVPEPPRHGPFLPGPAVQWAARGPSTLPHGVGDSSCEGKSCVLTGQGSDSAGVERAGKDFVKKWWTRGDRGVRRVSEEGPSGREELWARAGLRGPKVGPRGQEWQARAPASRRRLQVRVRVQAEVQAEVGFGCREPELSLLNPQPCLALPWPRLIFESCISVLGLP